MTRALDREHLLPVCSDSLTGALFWLACASCSLATVKLASRLAITARLRVLGQPRETRSIIDHAATDEGDGFQRERIGKGVEREVPLLAAHDDFAAKQLCQVLRDELMLHVEVAREIGDRARAVREDFEQLKSGGMPEHAQPARSDLHNVA